MALTYQGQGGNQDVMRRAAQGVLSDMSGGGGQQAAGGPQTSVGNLLAQATDLTMKAPNLEEALLPWRQALMFLGEQLKAARGGGGQQMGGSPPQVGPSPMQSMAAQAVPVTGRPPR